MKYWSNPKLGGGPLSNDIQTEYESAISTPMKLMLYTTETFGYFKITKIKYSAELTSYLYDIWISVTDQS